MISEHQKTSALEYPDRTAGTDGDLWSRFSQKGSTQAFEALVKRHSSMVFAATYRILGDRQMAEDATQACFLLLFQRARSLPPSTVLPGWLHACAVHCARHLLRREARLKQRERKAVRDEKPSGDLEHIRPELDVALAKLPLSQREALVLRFLYGLSQKEAARELGCAEETIHTRVRRGLEKLRRMLIPADRKISLLVLTVYLEEQTFEEIPETLSSSIVNACIGGGQVTEAAHNTAQALSKGYFKLQGLTALPACLALAALIFLGISIQEPTDASALQGVFLSLIRSGAIPKANQPVVRASSSRTHLFAPASACRFDLKNSLKWRTFGSLPLRQSDGQVEVEIKNPSLTHWHAGGLIFHKPWDLREGTLRISLVCVSSTDLTRHWVGVCVVPAPDEGGGDLMGALAEAALYQPQQTWEPLRAHLKKVAFKRRTVRTEVCIAQATMSLRIDGSLIFEGPRSPSEAVFVGFRALARNVQSLETVSIRQVEINWRPNPPKEMDAF